MGLVFTDGCDSYSVTADILKKWSGNSFTSGWSFSSSGGRNGGGALVFTAGAGLTSVITPAIYPGTSIGSHCFGFWFKAASAPNADCGLMRFYTAAGQANGGPLNVLPSGSAGVLKMLNGLGNVSQGNGSRNVCDNNWHYIEYLWNFTAGSVSTAIYVDGVVDFVGNTGGNNATFPSFVAALFANNNNAMSYSLDDVIMYDDQSGSLPGTAQFPLGVRRIDTLRPNGDSAAGFATVVGGSGTHASALSETAGDSDTSYVQDGSGGNQDLYTFPSIGFTPATISAVMANGYAKCPGAGTGVLKQICKNSSTQTDGSPATLTQSYAPYQQMFGLDPNTGAAWTRGGLDGALFGVKVG